MGSLDKQNKWGSQNVEIRSRPTMWLLYGEGGAGVHKGLGLKYIGWKGGMRGCKRRKASRQRVVGMETQGGLEKSGYAAGVDYSPVFRHTKCMHPYTNVWLFLVCN